MPIPSLPPHSRPRIAITMGDAAGIGPEIIVKALADFRVHECCRPLVVGDAKILERAARFAGVSISIRPIGEPTQAKYETITLQCLQHDLLPADLPVGRVNGAAGAAAYHFIEVATRLALTGDVDAITTAPINKESLRAAGIGYPGHTEIFAALTGSDDYAMMFTAPELRTILVTVHVGLREAVSLLSLERVYRTICLAHHALATTGATPPRIGVCGINPHAGENGLFGDGEEERCIVPAIRRACAEGLLAVGPLPADTAFVRARRGEFDIVVAMYHDQGLAPVKVLAFDECVNVTVGLPIVRTSVDHGTAFDLAGTGRASAVNLIAAIREAVRLVERREGKHDA